MAFNDIICDPNAPIVCAEAMTEHLLDCSLRSADKYWDIGVARTTPRIQDFAEGCHNSIQTKFWLPFDYSKGGIVRCDTNDAPGDEDCAPCNTLSQGLENMFKLYSRHCFGMDDCEAQCMGADEDDVIDIVVERMVSPIMIKDRVNYMFSEFIGLYDWAATQSTEDQKAEMIVDLGDNCLDHCAGIDLNTLRDCGMFDAMYVHSDVYRNMRKNGCLQEKACCGDTDFQFDALADGTAIIPVDRKTANEFMLDEEGCYISFAFNFGVFEYAEGRHKTPVERDRDPKANCGDGSESIFFRSTFALRPMGTQFDTTGLARDYAGCEELADGARWNVSIPVEDFGIAFVKSCCTA